MMKITGVSQTRLHFLMRAYNATGRLAFHHPRLHQVSLDGGRRMSEHTAIERMTACLAPKNEPTYYDVETAHELGMKERES